MPSKKKVQINDDFLDDVPSSNLSDEELDKIMDEWVSRHRLDNFCIDLDHAKSRDEYYEILSRAILVCRVFDDDEIQRLSNLVRTKWIGKSGNKIRENDEDFVFHTFIATPGMNDEEGPPRSQAIKIIMKELGKTDSAAAKLYDKVMRSYRIPPVKRGRKKGNNKI